MTHTVTVILEATSGKEEELKQALLEVIEPSRSEPGCLDYRLHQDITDPNIFLLHETWESQDKHALQFEKNYIKSLGEKLDTLLTKPYQVVMSSRIA